MRLSIVVVAVYACVAGVGTSLAETLITEAEAKLPASTDVGMTTRGLTRGPGVELVSPNPDHIVPSPVPLKVKFIARNNVAIDPASVRLIYLKEPNIDLTERIKSHLTSSGIDMTEAEIPPGTHHLRISLRDSQGRASTMTVKIIVAPKS